MSYVETNPTAKNAAEGLLHYLQNAGCDVSGDQASEIRSIVDDIITATVEEVGKVLEKALVDKGAAWRIDHLYRIVDGDGNSTGLRLNDFQRTAIKALEEREARQAASGLTDG